MDFLIRKEGKSSKPLDPEAPTRFLAAAAKAEETTHATPGLGSDHRLRFRWGHGAALRVDGLLGFEELVEAVDGQDKVALEVGHEEVLRMIFGEVQAPLRAAALKLGLNCIGLLGILIEVRRQNLIPRLAPHLDRLQNEARFGFSQSRRIQVLQLAGEIP